MRKYALERRISLYKIRKYTDITRVFQKQGIIYGKYLDVIEHEKPKIIFSRLGNVYSRRDAVCKDRTKQSSDRARTTLRRIVEANCGKWGEYKPVFATLTQAENQKSLNISNMRFTAFIKRCNYFIGHSLKYVAVPEFQKRGSVHYHIVFFNLPFVNLKQFEETWGYGTTNVQLMRKQNRTASYLAKYFSKSFTNSRNFNKKSFFSSRGLIRPVPIYGAYEVDEYIKNRIMKKEYEQQLHKIKLIKYVDNT